MSSAPQTLNSTLPLLHPDGATIPVLGFGTCQSSRCTDSALYALQNEYTHFDTAQIYGNEKETGTAISKSPNPPEKLFICSKLWENNYGTELAVASVKKSCLDLQVKYIDLYLLHTPRPGARLRHESWLGLQIAQKEGYVKTIGVSNWAPRHFEQLMQQEGVAVLPAVNQIEFHPWQQQKLIREYCKSKGIVVVAYSPLTQGRRLNDTVIRSVAEEVAKTPAQVVLRWCLQRGVVVIPKSDKEDRILENKDVFGFELNEKQMSAIDALDEGQKGNVGEWDPFAWD